MTDTQDFSGLWHNKYTYYNDIETSGTSEHDIKIYKTGNQLVLQSVPNQEDSYFVARLTLDGDLLTGTWQEQTSPTGKYKGQIYYGAAQLIRNEGGKRMHGKMVMINHELEIITGDWEVVKTDKNSTLFMHNE